MYKVPQAAIQRNSISVPVGLQDRFITLYRKPYISIEAIGSTIIMVILNLTYETLCGNAMHRQLKLVTFNKPLCCRNLVNIRVSSPIYSLHLDRYHFNVEKNPYTAILIQLYSSSHRKHTSMDILMASADYIYPTICLTLKPSVFNTTCVQCAFVISCVNIRSKQITPWHNGRACNDLWCF